MKTFYLNTPTDWDEQQAADIINRVIMSATSCTLFFNTLGEAEASALRDIERGFIEGAKVMTVTIKDAKE